VHKLFAFCRLMARVADLGTQGPPRSLDLCRQLFVAGRTRDEHRLEALQLVVEGCQWEGLATLDGEVIGTLLQSFHFVLYSNGIYVKRFLPIVVVRHVMPVVMVLEAICPQVPMRRREMFAQTVQQQARLRLDVANMAFVPALESRPLHRQRRQLSGQRGGRRGQEWEPT